jgi:hypothetical protein
VESEEESFVVSVEGEITAGDIMERLSGRMPDGLAITRCVANDPFRKKPAGPVTYRVYLRPQLVEKERVSAFFAAPSVWMTKKRHKGQTLEIDLRAVVSGVSLAGEGMVEITLSDGQPRVRPFEIVKHVFGLSDSEEGLCRVVKKAPETNFPG